MYHTEPFNIRMLTLQEQLDKAVAQENYELAAVLRDRIAAGDQTEPLPDHYKQDWVEGMVRHHIDGAMRRAGERFQAECERTEKRYKLLCWIERYDQEVTTELDKRLKKLLKKLLGRKFSMAAIADVTKVIDHRELTVEYFFVGQRVLMVSYSENGVKFK